MLLPTLIDLRRPLGKELDPEDIFGSSLGGIFTDDLQNQHGDDPDTTIVYKNLRHGDVEFRAAEVNGEEQRRKMAHYLWNAGVLMAELVGGRPSEEQQQRIAAALTQRYGRQVRLDPRDLRPEGGEVGGAGDERL